MTETVKTKIEELVGDEARVIDGDFERELYSMDIGEVPFAKRLFDTTPELVIMPKSVESLKKIVRFANAEKIALFPRGSASSGLGGVVPTVKGIVLDLSSMNKIVELNREQETVKVQTGVRWSDIEDFLRPETLALRAYPSSFFSSVGGWIATGGYGIGSYRFGHLKDQIELIEVMFPSGEVKSINSKDEEFTLFFGTEGQFGIVLSAILKLRKKPEKSLPHLIYLESAEDAFVFITELINAELKPNHIKYMDASHLEEANTFLGEHLFRLKDAILLEFEEEEEATKFRKFAEGRGILADDYLSNYLWHERLFPMKKRCDMPTPLACEMVISLENAVLYLKEAKIILNRCGVYVEVESHIVGKDRALLMLTYMSDVREPKTYLTHISLIPVLTRLGLKFGGVPYGIGIWNTPFINDKYDTKTLELYRAYKKEVDPNNILNPNKFFAVKTKMANIPGIMFKPRIFGPLIRISATVTPILGKRASSKGGLKEESVLEKIVYSCNTI